MSARKADDVAPQRGSFESECEAKPRQASTRTSLVHQKLQTALSQAEKTATDLAHVETDASFRISTRHDGQPCDRNVSRYRNEAAIVSFTDPASAFTYTSNFMPGVHFYTFLAAKESNSTSSKMLQLLLTSNSNKSHDPAAATAKHASENDSADASKPHHLTKKAPPLRMWIPDTIVYGESGRAVWLYSDKDGFLQRTTDVTEKQVLEKFANPAATSESERVIVYKEPVVTSAKNSKNAESNVFTSQGNQMRLLGLAELKTLLSTVLSMKKSFAIQKFVKCNGSKAFVVRSVYDAGKPAYAWMISNTTPFLDNSEPASDPALSNPEVKAVLEKQSTATSTTFLASPRSQTAASTSGNASIPTELNNVVAPANAIPLANRLCTSVQVDKSCTFVKLNERGCATVSELNLRVVKYIEQRLHVHIRTLVTDFVKDASGRWWLIQVKAFRVKNKQHPDRPLSLPLKTRILYLSYRGSHVLEDNTDSEDEHGENGHHAKHHSIVPLAHRHIRKLIQCKCCLAAYPKSELSFKMTLKMINDMLMRIRARLPTDKRMSFLTAALSREPPDASLAYESWSVCSYCYAIYERDLQLQRMEAKFAVALGTPSALTAEAGLSAIQDHMHVLDPSTSTTIIPSQLTLCRLMLVLNAIYDIPKELYDAEKLHMGEYEGETGTKTSRIRGSHLYLRITALGYTECIPVNAEDIELAREKAPRSVFRRRESVASTVDGEEEESEAPETLDQHPGRKLSDLADNDDRNYWLPINLIRTIHFFAPRTPLQSKLKETSGITPFLTEDNSIHVQFIRATEPPLQDPTIAQRKVRNRRGALAPEVTSVSDMVTQMRSPSHSIVLGATKIRMAQFRSAYVTKIDFYACMAITGELFNIKGNVGLERVRYIDSKLVTSQYRLRAYNGVFIPDDSYLTSDALSQEWMDCLRETSHRRNRTNSPSMTTKTTSKNHRQTQPSEPSNRHDRFSKFTGSTVSLRSNSEEMDQELEEMIERANGEQVHEQFRHVLGALPTTQSPSNFHIANADSDRSILNSEDLQKERGQRILGDESNEPSIPSIAGLKQGLIPSTSIPSRVDLQMSMLMNKTIQSPRSALVSSSSNNGFGNCSSNATSNSPLSPQNRKWIWCLMILLNQAYNVQSREHAFCRWECHYLVLDQKRSAVERSAPQTPSSTADFSCTHKFFLLGTTSAMQTYLINHPTIKLHLRNDVYASTRSKSSGEFYCILDLTKLHQSKGFDTTLDIFPTKEQELITPREAAAIASASPYLSASVQLSQLPLDPEDALVGSKFVEVGHTPEGLQILRKIS